MADVQLLRRAGRLHPRRGHGQVSRGLREDAAGGGRARRARSCASRATATTPASARFMSELRRASAPSCRATSPAWLAPRHPGRRGVRAGRRRAGAALAAAHPLLPIRGEGGGTAGPKVIQKWTEWALPDRRRTGTAVEGVEYWKRAPGSSPPCSPTSMGLADGTQPGTSDARRSARDPAPDERGAGRGADGVTLLTSPRGAAPTALASRVGAEPRLTPTSAERASPLPVCRVFSRGRAGIRGSSASETGVSLARTHFEPITDACSTLVQSERLGTTHAGR